MKGKCKNSQWLSGLLTTKAIASEMNVCTRTISNWRMCKGFPYYKSGSIYLHDPEEVAEWVRKNTNFHRPE